MEGLTTRSQDLPFNTVISMIENAYEGLNSVGKFPSSTKNGVVTLDPLYVKQYILNYTTPIEADAIWRIVLLLGCAPAAALFYKVLVMPETTRYTALVKGDAVRAIKDLEQEAHIKVASNYAEAAVVNNSRPPNYLPAREFFRKYGVWLLGTSLSWFLLDVSFYAQGLYGSVIYSDVGFIPAAGAMSAIHETYM